MQDCYAFDVGNFGTLGLLRHIHRVTNLRLGVLWWRTTLGTTGSDGKHVAYLQNPAFRACDPDLWEEMRRRFNPGARTIADLHPLLPAGTLFLDTPVPARARRWRWLDEAVSKCFRHQLLLPRPYLVLTKSLRLDIQCQRGASVKIGWKYLDD